MNWLAQLDVIVLALMLGYVVVLVIHLSYRYQTARSARRNDDSTKRKLAADLSAEISDLKSIASTAPYCGLVGACVGAMGAFTAVGMEKHAALAMISSRLAAALVTTLWEYS